MTVDRDDVLRGEAIATARAVQDDVDAVLPEPFRCRLGIDGAADEIDLGMGGEGLPDLGEAGARARDEDANTGVSHDRHPLMPVFVASRFFWAAPSPSKTIVASVSTP